MKLGYKQKTVCIRFTNILVPKQNGRLNYEYEIKIHTKFKLKNFLNYLQILFMYIIFCSVSHIKFLKNYIKYEVEISYIIKLFREYILLIKI